MSTNEYAFAPPSLVASTFDDSPKPDLRAALAIVGLLGAVFLSWANLAPLDAAATAAGQIEVSGHNQIVAHREGGVLASVDVVEGQHVRAGQVLAHLAPEDVGAEVSALSAQVVSLQAQQARLLAELQGQASITWPQSFSSLSGDDRTAMQAALRIQQVQFEADLGELRAQSAVSASHAMGLAQQVAGGEGELRSNQREQALLDQQLVGIRALAAKGYAPLNSVRALERSDAELSGAHDQIQANIAQYRDQIAQDALSQRGLHKQFMQVAASGLRDVGDQLSVDLPKLQAAKAQLDRGTLRAQADGVVTGLSVFAPGTVVGPGQVLMQVVPSHPSLVIEARLAANDIRGVHIGQRAQVRVPALGSRGDPILRGAVTDLSADSFMDEHTGRRFYLVTVSVPLSQLKLLDRSDGADVFRAGMPAQVTIPLRERTALDYLFGPLTQSLGGAFHER
jgi:HlyD family secretion protein